MGRVEAPLHTETLWLCNGWVPFRSPIPACASWMLTFPGCLSGMQLASTRFSCCQDSFTQDNN